MKKFPSHQGELQRKRKKAQNKYNEKKAMDIRGAT
jgi:hypothetical protein